MAEETKKPKKKKTDPAIVEANRTIIQRRWGKKKPSDKKVKEAMRVFNQKRWGSMTAEQRSAFMRAAVANHPRGPMDPYKMRCPCGAMTLKRAETRADKNGTGKGHKPGCKFYRPETEAAA